VLVCVSALVTPDDDGILSTRNRKRPDGDMSAFDGEAYTLSCGIALGMSESVSGRTSDIDRAAGIADLRVEERLYRYIVGSVDSDEDSA
jgi:hypothetical protein